MDVKSISVAIGLAVMLAISAWPVVLYGFRSLRKQGIAFAVICSLFLYSMANKAPHVIYDDYIADNGTCWMTNGVQKIGVNFKWRKTNILLPDSQPLYISSAPTNSPTSWSTIVTTTVGANQHAYSHQDPAAYYYFIWHEWMPPSPVHTNGVWLGTIIEKAKGSTGTDKMIIIHGQLDHNGKVLTP